MPLVDISPPGIDRYTLIRLAALYSGMERSVLVALDAANVSLGDMY
jgi:hypothetical protein